MLCVARIVLLLKMRIQKGSEAVDSAFIQWKDCTGPADAVDNMLGGMCVR